MPYFRSCLIESKALIDVLRGGKVKTRRMAGTLREIELVTPASTAFHIFQASCFYIDAVDCRGWLDHDAWAIWAAFSSLQTPLQRDQSGKLFTSNALATRPERQERRLSGLFPKE